MIGTAIAPRPKKRSPIFRALGFVSLRFAQYREKKALRPIELGNDEIAALREFASGGQIVDFSLATLRVERDGAPPVSVAQTTVAYLQSVKFVKQNSAGMLVITDRGRAAVSLAAKAPARLQAGEEGMANELVRKELLVRVARHEKWLARAMGGKQLIASFADLEDVQLDKRNLSQIKLEGCLLCGANLARSDLSGAVLQGCDLSHADLRNARLRSADLRGCDFTDARLDGADLSGAVFGHVRAETMERVRLAHARAIDLGKIEPTDEPLPPSLAARFDRARLAGADLRGADLAQASFRAAVLTGADLRDTKIGGCDFAYADLAGARMSGAQMREANFSLSSGVADFAALGRGGANIGHRPDPKMLAHIIEANRLWYQSGGAEAAPGTPSGARAVLAGMNLAEMDLAGAWLAAADLREANLSGARLADAVLIHADLRGANLAGADLVGADLRHAKMPEGSAGS